MERKNVEIDPLSLNLSDIGLHMLVSNGGSVMGGGQDDRGSRLDVSVRELCQNSVDGALDIGEDPRVEIAYDEVDSSLVPGWDDVVVPHVREFLDMRPDDTNKRAKIYKRLIKKKKIGVLTVSDNGSGLTNPFMANSPRNYIVSGFLAVFGEMTSTKGSGKGGSIGIGASYAKMLSPVQYIVYSTETMDGQRAYKGSVSLPSIEAPDGVQYTGEGYLSIPCEANGRKEYAPYPDTIDFPGIPKRGEHGTDAIVIGVDFDRNWMEQALLGVVKSFPQMIIDGRYSVSIFDRTRGKKMEIGARTWRELLSKYAKMSQKDVSMTQVQEELASAYWSMCALSDPMPLRHVVYESKHGPVRFYVARRDDGKPGHAQIVRNGMMTEKTKTRARDAVSRGLVFVAVVEGEEMNDILRDAEDEIHEHYDRKYDKRVSHALKGITDYRSDIVAELTASRMKDTYCDIATQVGAGEDDPSGTDEHLFSRGHASVSLGSMNKKTRNTVKSLLTQRKGSESANAGAPGSLPKRNPAKDIEDEPDEEEAKPGLEDRHPGNKSRCPFGENIGGGDKGPHVPGTDGKASHRTVSAKSLGVRLRIKGNAITAAFTPKEDMVAKACFKLLEQSASTPEKNSSSRSIEPAKVEILSGEGNVGDENVLELSAGARYVCRFEFDDDCCYGVGMELVCM